MHDRAVRRRRAVLVVLVTASLILLTAYFGESQDGRLHSAQRGALGALSPIQEGASRVLKPFRDLFGWFGDTIDAKDQRDKAEAERDALRTQLADAQNRAAGGRAAGARSTSVDTTGGMNRYGPVDARVYLHSPSSWYQSLQINKGTDDGVKEGDPVINGAGLVGKVETATGGSAVVTLITDPEFATGGITSVSQEPGSVVPAVGAPGDLLFKFVDNATKVRKGEIVYTAGTTSSRLESRYPPAIPIGTVDRDRHRRRRARPPHPHQARRRPQARGHGAGPDRAPRRPGRQVTITTASVIRLALLGLIGGLFQLSVVSQVTIFGVPADLTPLMVAFAGFIAGSMTGAVFGFCLGLFIDVSLYQTLGVSSLVFTAVGYGTGRIRELRDPAHGLAPVAVGAAATAIAAVGFTLLQFLLGVQSPVSLMLLREILLTVVLNTLIALPVYAIMRRALLPFLPEDPRRRRRRAYTTGGLSPISRL